MNSFETTFNKPETKKNLFGNSEENKLGLYLVYLGVKPATMLQLFSLTWQPNEATQPVPPERISAVMELLDDSGLHYEQLNIMDALPHARRAMTVFLVAREKAKLLDLRAAWSNLNEHNRPADNVAHGRALGYPETALEAFKLGATLGNAELPAEYRSAEAAAFALYRYSVDNYAQEFELAKTWAAAVRNHNPAFYQAVIDQHRLHAAR